MLAYDTTPGLPTGKIYMSGGTSLTFFNADGTRSKEIIADGSTTAVTLQMSSSGAVAMPAHTLTLDKNISAKGTLNLNSSIASNTTLHVAGLVQDSDAPLLVTMGGPGTVRLSAANTFTNGSNITAGVLQLGHDQALGLNTVSLGGGHAFLGQCDGSHFGQ